MKISNETKVGVFVAISITVLILGYNYLKGNDLLNSKNHYFALYDRIDGLIESNSVLLYGYKVGMIESVKLTHRSDKHVLVRFTVDPEVRIPVGSKAKVVSTDLLGAKALKLEFSDSNVFLESKDTLSGFTELSLEESVSQILSPLSNKANHLVTTLSGIIDDLDTFLNKGGRRDLKHTFMNIRNSFSNIEQTTSKLNEFVHSETGTLKKVFAYAENIAKTLNDNRDEIDNFLEGISSLSDSLQASQIKETIGNANIALENFSTITDKINNGEGSIGLLLNNDSLYYNLENASNNLDKLVFDLKENPNRYLHFSLFGRKDKDKKKK